MTELLAAVEVPATSANLGPGFDALAAALDVRTLVAAAPRGPQRVVVEGVGAGELPTDDRNLVWRAFAAWCVAAGADVPDVSLRTRNTIPLERGMGSSAAAEVGGLALARALVGGTGGDADVIRLAADLEGHPDNAAAAVLGGVVLCWDGRYIRFEPSRDLRPVVCIPRTRQATEAARGVLPTHVTLAAAAANGARTAAVLAGLVGAAAFDPAAMRDVLHEPPRLEVMGASGELVRALRGADVAACLSGAGPSVLAIVRAGDADAVQLVRDRAGDAFDVLPSGWDRAGARACPPGRAATS